MSTHRGGKRPLWTCLTVLAVFAVAFCAATPAAHAEGGKKKHPNPNTHKLTSDKADAMIVQLANDVFKRAVRAHNSALDRTEFHKATDLVRGEILTWARNGTLRQIRQCGWKPNFLVNATAGTSGTGLVDIPKIEKSLKVSLPQFTDYTRYLVNQGEHTLPNAQTPKAAHPKYAYPVPRVRKEVIVAKPAVTKTVHVKADHRLSKMTGQ